MSAPTLAVLLSALLWGTLWIPLRGLRAAAPGGPLPTAVAFALPAVVLLPFMVGRARGMRRADAALWSAGLCMGLSVALYAEGLLRGTVARVILLFYLTPVWSTLLARWLLDEPITRRRTLAIALGLAGLLVVLGDGLLRPAAVASGEWMGLSAGVLWGLALVHVRRSASRPLLERVFVQFLFLGPLFAIVALLPGAPAAGSPNAALLAAAWPWLAAVGLVWMLPVMALTLFGAGHLDPGRVAIVLMLEIAVGLTSAALLAHEPFGGREVAGALLILAATGVEVGRRPARPGAP